MAASRPKSRTVTGASPAPVAPAFEETVTFEVVKSFCGLPVGTRRTVRNSPDIRETERLGYIKYV